MVNYLVSQEDLAATYDPHTAWETVQQYRTARRLSNEQPDLARAEIARRVDRSPSAVRGWLAEGKTPAPVKAIETAREHGWLSVESTSETFRALNQLVAWIFSGGGIRHDRFVPIFSVDDQLALATIDHLLRWADLSYRIRDNEGAEQALEVIPDESASILGRVLYVLGAPRGVKAAQEDLTLPTYLDTVADAHRRDFARIYLLNRGAGIDSGEGTGVYLYESRESTYRRALRDFLADVTTGSVTHASQDRIWVSADAVRDLAESDTAPIRPVLATRAVYGSLTPPTEQALADTYRQGKRPGGARYATLYKQVANADTSPTELAEQYPDLAQQTIRNWQRGHVPRVHNALIEADAHGWLTPPTDSTTALSLTALVAWVFARGTIRANSYFPVFRIGEATHRALFTSLAEALGLSYSLAREDDPERPTEIHLSDDGVLLGRILYTLGAPLGTKQDKICLPPVYLYHRRRHARRFFAVWCRHHANDTDDDNLRLRMPTPLGERFCDAFQALLTEHFSWTVERSADGVIIRAPPDELDTLDDLI